MPFRYQRKYERKGRNRSMNTKKCNNGDSYCDYCSKDLTINSSTHEQISCKSPDIIGSDWNDTFDRLKNDGSIRTTPKKVSEVWALTQTILTVENSSSIQNDASSFNKEMYNLSDADKENYCKRDTEVESDIGSLCITVDRAHPYDNNINSYNGLVPKISTSYNKLRQYKTPNSKPCHNKPIAESTPYMMHSKSRFSRKLFEESVTNVPVEYRKSNKSLVTSKGPILSSAKENEISQELPDNFQNSVNSFYLKTVSSDKFSLKDFQNRCSVIIQDCVIADSSNSNVVELDKSVEIVDSYKSENVEKTKQFSKKSIKLLPGKKWRRSLHVYIHNSSFSKQKAKNNSFQKSVIGEEPTNEVPADLESEDVNDNLTNLTIVDKLSYISISSDDLEYSPKSNASHKSTTKSRVLFANEPRITEVKPYDPSPATASEVVLRRCGQTEPVPFSQCYSDSALRNCHKIGEGLFGEVFLYKDCVTKECSVIKIIPIEGSLIVNGEKQKKFCEILSEIIIVMELSDLRSCADNVTSGFCQLKKISCVKGKYPECLLNLWELYDEQYGSENDNPQVFDDDQLYIVLELGNGGRDLEAYQFTNAKQSLSVFRQATLSLAVAEKALQFEHRDLHWGNILIVPTAEKTISFTIDGEVLSVPSNGVKATIIDFTFSRITLNDQALFSDIGADEELFSADGDYQFDIYRLMRQKNKNNWGSYQPYSNVLWLHYLADKMITGARYTHRKSKVHNLNVVELQLIKDSLLQYDNVHEFLKDFNYFQ